VAVEWRGASRGGVAAPASDPPAQVERARALLEAAKRVVVLTGAGISTDSGIPDFRGPQGLWTCDPDAERMATLRHYLADASLRRRAWQLRLQMAARQRTPNAGHRALLALERRGVLDLLITQNVDGLHHASGIPAERIVEIHGAMRDFVCTACGVRGAMERALARVRAGEEDPACLQCGGILKSATVFFGENVAQTDWQRAQRAARRCDLLLAVGSSLSVQPVAGVVRLARDAGALVVIVNGEPTQLDALADARVSGSISARLQQLLGTEHASDGG